MQRILREELEQFVPGNEQERRDRELFLQWLDSGTELYTRENRTAHLTASAWVVSPDRAQVLMAYHNLYDSWAWLGGHADGETDLLAVAEREVKEESGLTEVTPLSREIASLEILCVDGHEKRGEYVSSHLHLNVTYLFEADPRQPVRCKPDENSKVGWFTPEEALRQSKEPWFCERIYRKLIERAAHFPAKEPAGGKNGGEEERTEDREGGIR